MSCVSSRPRSAALRTRRSTQASASSILSDDDTLAERFSLRLPFAIQFMAIDSLHTCTQPSIDGSESSYISPPILTLRGVCVASAYVPPSWRTLRGQGVIYARVGKALCKHIYTRAGFTQSHSIIRGSTCASSWWRSSWASASWASW